MFSLPQHKHWQQREIGSLQQEKKKKAFQFSRVFCLPMLATQFLSHSHSSHPSLPWLINMLQPAFYSPTTLHHRSSHRLCITGVVQLGWAVISVAELSAMKAITEHPELPLTKSSLSPLNSQLTKTSQASSLGVIIPKAQGRWRNQKKLTQWYTVCFALLYTGKRQTFTLLIGKCVPMIQ